MRLRIVKIIVSLLTIVNLVEVYFIWNLLSTCGSRKIRSRNSSKSENQLVTATFTNAQNDLKRFDKFLHGDVTFVIRSFEQFDHDIVETVTSVLNVYPNVTLLVITDEPLYPPVIFNMTSPQLLNVKFTNLKASLSRSFKEIHPILQISTKYVFFIPDSTRITSRKLIDKLVNISNKDSDKIIAVPYKNMKETKCLTLNLNIKEWVIRFDELDQSPSKECNFINGKHALFIEKQNLLNISDPLMRPFPDSLYIQFASKQNKVILADDLQLNNGRELFKNHHNKWKLQQAEKDRQKLMFHTLGLKKVIRENGVIEWFGCRKDTPRCFGSIVNETPQYLWEGKWTPPCCLAGLRRTARHVFEQLEKARVRYWLEGGSLLGAIRSGDILPWDYDVDIGIYREDISKCTWLLRAGSKPVTDQQGFVWEKAIEGDFYRVQFSQVNRLHVDIFPFYPKNGTMTKDTWFKTHPQDREFPEHYLKPLSTIDFVGWSTSAPNNIHDFLELKFGSGAIDHPEYPNPRVMAIHGQSVRPVNGS